LRIEAKRMKKTNNKIREGIMVKKAALKKALGVAR
jgi:hypothetical protein